MKDEKKSRQELILELQEFRRSLETREGEIAALRQSETELRTIVGSLDDMVLRVDRQGRHLKMLVREGLTAPGMVAEPSLGGIVPRAASPSMIKGIRKALRWGKVVKLEERMETEGKEVWISVTISPIAPDSVVCVVRDITDLKSAESALHMKTVALEETNTALKVLLTKTEEARKEVEDHIISNVKMLVMPYIEKMARLEMSNLQEAYLSVIESNLKNIASPFLHGLTGFNLTPTEMQVANYIRDGRTTKEIMEVLHASKGAIDTHRYNIRKKLGINNEKINLRSYLLALH